MEVVVADAEPRLPISLPDLWPKGASRAHGLLQDGVRVDVDERCRARGSGGGRAGGGRRGGEGGEGGGVLLPGLAGARRQVPHDEDHLPLRARLATRLRRHNVSRVVRLVEGEAAHGGERLVLPSKRCEDVPVGIPPLPLRLLPQEDTSHGGLLHESQPSIHLRGAAARPAAHDRNPATRSEELQVTAQVLVRHQLHYDIEVAAASSLPHPLLRVPAGHAAPQPHGFAAVLGARSAHDQSSLRAEVPGQVHGGKSNGTRSTPYQHAVRRLHPCDMEKRPVGSEVGDWHGGC
mmetsp:Transcript_95420/g.279010  ORF Transcript_95420/g.279010 Transcript_95420/m.279010 type:complete len:291 (+) Transcript_95420:430-1302(+)